jgi:hypothetical protein
MLPPGYLILFFGLPATLLLLNFCCLQFAAVTTQIAPLYGRFIMQLIKIRTLLNSPFRGLGGFMLVLLFAQNATAQSDSNYVDTTSMQHIDTVVVSNRNEEPVGYDDQNDGYVDTTIKHIYDTSQYFFTWKDSINDPFINKKIIQRQLIDAEVDALKKEDDFWYIPAIEKLETRLKNDPKFRDSLLQVSNHQLMDEKEMGFLYQPWFTTLMWIIIIGIFVTAVIYFLAQNKINIFSKESISSSDNESNEEGEDIFHLSYTKLIQNAEKGKDYRNAVRLMFLQTLKLLSDTNAIHYQPDYTNFDYLQQLKPTKYHNEFFDVMHNYEYVWYGKFDISAAQYTAIKNKFLKLQHTII